METLRDYDGGYRHDGLIEIESTLLWAEEHLQAPQINCLEGWGVPTQSPDSPTNRRWMRVFTTMSNRSGAAQTVTLPASATPVSDRKDNAASPTHLLPDLDGEIYLTTRSFADVNSDGRVNILDLVQVANGFGKSTPDPNGDGVVNILDLVFVAQQFSQ